MIPACVLIAIAVRGRDRRLRLASAIATVPLLLAAYLTYNRTVFLGLWLLAVVIGWRFRRWVGVAILVGGLALGALLLPSYVALRGQAVGAGSQPTPGETLIASDQQRLTAWSTAGRMFLDEPILGQGYRAYRQLSVAFGDPTLNAPHNEWLRFFAEGGIATGLLGAAFALATLLGLARRPGWLETGLLASFLAFCLAASFNNPFLFNQVTIPAFIVAGTGIGLTLKDRRASAADV
jgi:O-antigen ligase